MAGASADGPIFTEVAQETGLVFRHDPGDSGEYHLPEIMGAGVALFDYDADGDLDVYLLQGRGPNRLFRNQLIEKGKLRFSDATKKSGLGDRGYAMGVAVSGQYVYVSNFGPDVFFRGNGDGTYDDVTKAVGLGDSSFGASASFLDYDRDGDPDLFLTRYVGFTVKGNKRCQSHIGEIDYCSPLEYVALPDKLYRNEAALFRDATVSAGVDRAFGNGLGVVARDFNQDGFLDVFVANDQTPNQLWVGGPDWRFEDQALSSGVAYNGHGDAEAGMGVAAGDYDNDGDLDLFVTHLRGQTNTLYRNDGSGFFDDVTNETGLGAPSVAMTGFGAGWLDYDNDGWLDLLVVNGDVRRSGLEARGIFPYGQPNQLFRNLGGRFEEIQAFNETDVSRGAAFGDIDLDGDLDVVVSNARGPARLYLNRVGSKNSSLMVAGPFLRVGLEREGEPTLWRWSGSDGSYLSSSSSSVHFGLGDSRPTNVILEWENGLRWVRSVDDSNPFIVRYTISP